MQGSFDKKDLERLVRWYEDVLKHIPGAKTKALQAAANAVHKELDYHIDAKIKGNRGKVKNWQQVTTGSRGGYVRLGPTSVPVANKYGKHYGYNAAQVTGFLERGHAARKPSGKDPNYVPRISDAVLSAESSSGHIVVLGKLFYSWTKMKASKLGYEAAAEVLEALSEEFVDLLYDLS